MTTCVHSGVLDYKLITRNLANCKESWGPPWTEDQLKVEDIQDMESGSGFSRIFKCREGGLCSI